MRENYESTVKQGSSANMGILIAIITVFTGFVLLISVLLSNMEVSIANQTPVAEFIRQNPAHFHEFLQSTFHENLVTTISSEDANSLIIDLHISGEEYAELETFGEEFLLYTANLMVEDVINNEAFIKQVIEIIEYLDGIELEVTVKLSHQSSELAQVSQVISRNSARW
jgi:hypothetical protein